MRKKVHHRCVGCGKGYPHGGTALFCSCGHFIDVQYDLEHAVLEEAADPYLRYFALLPLEDSANLIPNRHGPTPCHHATALGRKLGLPWLYLKDETVLPTGTTKDRMATVVLSYCRELGIDTLCASSTGNSTTAMAHGTLNSTLARLFIFAAEDFLDRVQIDRPDERITVFALRDATFVEACEAAKAFAVRRGFPEEGGFFNPARREGLKLAFLEAAEAIPRPIDWYVQAVSSAMGVYGAFKGAKELAAMGRLTRLPRLLCVQQDSNKPMVSAFAAGAATLRPQDIVAKPTGIATAILRGDPRRVYPYVRQIVLESGGTMRAVSEQQIRDARLMVEELEGITPCFTAATAVAGLADMAAHGELPRTDTILVNLTGRERPPGRPDTVHWLTRTDTGWKPEDNRNAETHELWRC